jgi:ABC-type dipeptide/oligopeptide/nickel transport system ATPase subunit
MEIRNRQELFLTMEKLFDMRVFQQMLHSPNPFKPLEPETEPVLLSHDAQIINSVCARYHFMYGTKKVLQNSAEDMLTTAGLLIGILKKEYHLE